MNHNLYCTDLPHLSHSLFTALQEASHSQSSKKKHPKNHSRTTKVAARANNHPACLSQIAASTRRSTRRSIPLSWSTSSRCAIPRVPYSYEQVILTMPCKDCGNGRLCQASGIRQHRRHDLAQRTVTKTYSKYPEAHSRGKERGGGCTESRQGKGCVRKPHTHKDILLAKEDG